MAPKDEEEAAFEAALAALKRTPASVRERRRQKIAAQMSELERELQLLDSLPGSINGSVDTAGQPPSADSGATVVSVAKAPNKPQGMLIVMAEQPARTWKLSDIRDVMVDRGWLQPGEKGTHQIQNTAWKLKSRGDVVSPRNAYYRITSRGLEAVAQ
jgi:hypothetical protein